MAEMFGREELLTHDLGWGNGKRKKDDLRSDDPFQGRISNYGTTSTGPHLLKFPLPPYSTKLETNSLTCGPLGDT